LIGASPAWEDYGDAAQPLGRAIKKLG
jgi:hypothetical protein